MNSNQYFQLFSTQAFAKFLQKRHNYREPDFLKPILKIDRTPQTQLLRASKRALLAAGKGYITSLGKGTKKEILDKEKLAFSGVPKDYALPKDAKLSQRRKSVVFKK